MLCMNCKGSGCMNCQTSPLEQFWSCWCGRNERLGRLYPCQSCMDSARGPSPINLLVLDKAHLYAIAAKCLGNATMVHDSFPRKLSPEEIEFNKRTLVFQDYPIICGKVGKMFMVSFHYLGS